VTQGGLTQTTSESLVLDLIRGDELRRDAPTTRHRSGGVYDTMAANSTEMVVQPVARVNGDLFGSNWRGF
jgi:hypothetical protein